MMKPPSKSLPPKVLFFGSLYAGHRTRFLNLQAHTKHDPRIVPEYRSVSGWVEGGLVEKVTFLPAGLRGRIRATAQASVIAQLPRPDAIWTSVWEVSAPFIAAMRGPLRRPLVVDLDRTCDQLESMAEAYFGRKAKTGAALAIARLLEKTLWDQATLFTPWSNWAAEGLVRRGVDPAVIRVLPPGVDLKAWRPPVDKVTDMSRRLRLLFVGGDFERKGGDLLLEALGRGLGGLCDLDIVTHETVVSPPAGVRVHRANPNSPELRDLYARADLFVLPTKADCFGLASVEAMASGLPVIMGNVGGARDIVSDGKTGWLIEPNTEALVAAIQHALCIRERLPEMGRQARVEAEARFDGRRNDCMIVDLILEQIARFRSQSARNRR
jgi:glycosyltransferase involved in cell wall biosynthesis